MKTIVVTGTDTEVGKTFVTCLLVRHLRDRQLRVGAWKPVCSGSVQDRSGADRWSDVDLLVEALGGNVDADRVCSQTFHAPVAPNVAARRQGARVDEGLLKRGPVMWGDTADIVVVEGAGGLLSPMSDSINTADVAVQLGAPVIIVAANRLGVINHTLMTVESAKSRSLTIAAVILNDVDTQSTDTSRTANGNELQRLLPKQTVVTLGNDSNDLVHLDGRPCDPLSLLGGVPQG